MPDAERESEYGAQHRVTPLELFFDLPFVFAITQVTVGAAPCRARLSRQ